MKVLRRACPAGARCHTSNHLHIKQCVSRIQNSFTQSSFCNLNEIYDCATNENAVPPPKKNKKKQKQNKQGGLWKDINHWWKRRNWPVLRTWKKFWIFVGQWNPMVAVGDILSDFSYLAAVLSIKLEIRTSESFLLSRLPPTCTWTFSNKYHDRQLAHPTQLIQTSTSANVPRDSFILIHENRQRFGSFLASKNRDKRRKHLLWLQNTKTYRKTGCKWECCAAGSASAGVPGWWIGCEYVPSNKWVANRSTAPRNPRSPPSKALPLTLQRFAHWDKVLW